MQQTQTERKLDDFRSDLIDAFQDIVRDEAEKANIKPGPSSSERSRAARIWFSHYLRHPSMTKNANSHQLNAVRSVLSKYTSDEAQVSNLASGLVIIVIEFQTGGGTSRVPLIEQGRDRAEEVLHWRDDGTGRPEEVVKCLGQLAAAIDAVPSRKLLYPWRYT